MQMFRKILVGVDLSSGDRLAAENLGGPTREAVRRAVWLAEQISAELTFFAALDISAQTWELLHDEYEEATQSVEDAAQAVLNHLVNDAKQEGVEAKAQLEFGLAWECLTKAVLRDGYDLVIVGTRDTGRASRFLFGSTATKLLRNCPCPVWVTKPDPDWDDLNILVATDLSEVSEQTMNLAVNAAQLSGAKLHVLHAIEDTVGTRMWLTGLPDEQLHQFHEKNRAAAEEAVQEQLAGTDHRTLPFGVKVHIVEGSPEVAILDAVEQYGIDLLIIGTAARSGIKGLLVGNTAERLISQAPCSLLAIKPPGFECPIHVDE